MEQTHPGKPGARMGGSSAHMASLPCVLGSIRCHCWCNLWVDNKINRIPLRIIFICPVVIPLTFQTMLLSPHILLASFLRHRLDSGRWVWILLQEHTVHRRRCLPGHVLSLADDRTTARSQEALVLVLQAWGIRCVRRCNGHTRPVLWSGDWLSPPPP